MMRPVTISRAHANDMAAMLALLRELFEIERDFEFDADKQARGLAIEPEVGRAGTDDVVGVRSIRAPWLATLDAA